MDSLSANLHEWALSIKGDFSIWSWVINIAYIISLMVSIYYIRRIRNIGSKEFRFLWICIASILLLLGINKQLNFQTLLIILGRSLAYKQGWIENRRAVQELFVIAFGIGIAIFGAIIIFRIRRILLSAWLEISGIAILLIFTLIRAGSIDHIYKTEKIETAFTHIHAIEFAGILIVLAALFRNFKKMNTRL
jgi:hypothetical protein